MRAICQKSIKENDILKKRLRVTQNPLLLYQRSVQLLISILNENVNIYFIEDLSQQFKHISLTLRRRNV